MASICCQAPSLPSSRLLKPEAALLPRVHTGILPTFDGSIRAIGSILDLLEVSSSETCLEHVQQAGFDKNPSTHIQHFSP